MSLVHGRRGLPAIRNARGAGLGEAACRPADAAIGRRRRRAVSIRAVSILAALMLTPRDRRESVQRRFTFTAASCWLPTPRRQCLSMRDVAPKEMRHVVQTQAAEECRRSRAQTERLHMVLSAYVGLGFAENSVDRAGGTRNRDARAHAATSTGDFGVMSVVKKAVTFAAQAPLVEGQGLDSSRYSSRRRRFAFNRGAVRPFLITRSRVQDGLRETCSLQASSQSVVRRSAAVVRIRDRPMLRVSDNHLQSLVRSAFLPNNWADCMLMWQRLLALCVAGASRQVPNASVPDANRAQCESKSQVEVSR